MLVIRESEERSVTVPALPVLLLGLPIDEILAERDLGRFIALLVVVSLSYSLGLGAADSEWTACFPLGGFGCRMFTSLGPWLICGAAMFA